MPFLSPKLAHGGIQFPYLRHGDVEATMRLSYIRRNGLPDPASPLTTGNANHDGGSLSLDMKETLEVVFSG